MPTFPVDLLTYLGVAKVMQQSFDLGEGLVVQNRTAGGEVLRSGGAARLWRGQLMLPPGTQQSARALHAKLHVLRGAGASFYIGDLTRPASPGTTGELRATNVLGAGDIIRLQGLPVGFVIAPGDYLGWDYQGRRALHQVVSGWTANVQGITGEIEVVPPIRTAPPVGHPVYVGAIKCKAVMVPGSLSIGISANGATDGASFEWTQTLRETT